MIFVLIVFVASMVRLGQISGYAGYPAIFNIRPYTGYWNYLDTFIRLIFNARYPAIRISGIRKQPDIRNKESSQKFNLKKQQRNSRLSHTIFFRRTDRQTFKIIIGGYWNVNYAWQQSFINTISHLLNLKIFIRKY